MSDEVISTAPKPFIFVLMPFTPEFNDTYKFGIKGAAEDVGAYAERVDEQLFTEGILDRIYNQINKADVIVADMTGQNSNVFYEVGYAHALNKIVLLLTKDANDIPFDLKHRPHIVYGGQIEKLKNELTERLKWAIAESQKRGKPEKTQVFEISIAGVDITEGSDLDNAPIISPVIEDSIVHYQVYVRNTSKKLSDYVDYIYLFSASNPVFIPNKIVSWTTTSSAHIRRTIKIPNLEPLSPFNAKAFDSIDGLNIQYRLDEDIDPMPPGAVSAFPMVFKFTGFKHDQIEIEEPFRLRIYSGEHYQDFPFKLRVVMKTLESNTTKD